MSLATMSAVDSKLENSEFLSEALNAIRSNQAGLSMTRWLILRHDDREPDLLLLGYTVTNPLASVEGWMRYFRHDRLIYSLLRLPAHVDKYVYVQWTGQDVPLNVRQKFWSFQPLMEQMMTPFHRKIATGDQSVLDEEIQTLQDS